MPEISIIILNYNTFNLTAKCIESVVAFTQNVAYEIILVDNNSTECDADLFKVKFPFITLIKNPHNSGFAKGNNLGIKASTSNFILLLNSDTYLIEDSISKSIAFLKREVGKGVVGCRMIYPNGGIQHTARRFRSIWWEILDLFRFLLFFIPYKKRATLMFGKYFKADFTTSCNWVNGAFFLFNKDILNTLPDNKLDDCFFMYGEDHLWCWQIKMNGYPILFYHETSIIHLNNGSTSIEKQLALRKVILKNELLIMKKRKGNGLYYYCFKLIFQCKEYSRILIKWIYFKISGKLLR